MSSLSTSLYGTSTNKGVGGLLSGLDTDELVKQMTAATRNKINRQYQSKQKLLYRQESYREISKKLLTFSDKYFSYASGSKTNILSPKFFESNTYKSSSNYVNVTGNADNIKNFEINSITSVATAASFTSSKKVTNQTVVSSDISMYTSSLAGETFSIKYDGITYNLSLSEELGKNYLVDGQESKVGLDAIVEELNKQLATIKDKNGNLINETNNLLKYKVETTEGQSKIVFDTSEDRKTAELSAASTDFLNVLKMKVGTEAASNDFIVTADLTRTAEEVINEGSITFEYNGVLKTISLSKMKEPKADNTYYTYDVAGLTEFLQKEINAQYGANKITVTSTGKQLSFKTNNELDVFGVSSISKELSNFTGFDVGDYNRVNKNEAIKDLNVGGLESKDVYKINVNGSIIDIDNNMSVTDIINKINSNAEAGVRVYYSSTTNTFSVKANDTGSHKSVSITDVSGSGNLASTLFGSGIDINNIINDDEYLELDKTNNMYNIYKNVGNEKVKVGEANIDYNNNSYNIQYKDSNGNVTSELSGTADYIVKPGTDTVMEYTLNGVKQIVTRSTANFTIDEINIELNEKAVGQASAGTPITFDVTNNSDEVVERVKQFINDYNEIINLIGTKTSEKPKRDYLPLTPEQQEEMEEEEIKNWNIEAKKGVLFGDSKMNIVLRRFRESMSGITDVSSITLSSIGISSASMDTSGKLVLDETKFKEKLLENPDEIANLFTLTSSKTTSDAKSGIAIQLQKILRDNVGAYGTTGLLIEEAGMDNSMTSDSNYISEKIEEYDEKMEELKDYLETERKRYWNQFSALEQSLNKLNSQSSWLTDMMG